MDRQVYIVGACRTPVGAFRGQYSTVPAYQLGAIVIEHALDRSMIPVEKVGSVIMGQVLSAGLGPNPARQAALAAKLPVTVPSSTINMVCGSAMRAIYDAFMLIRADEYDVVIAGGQENMTLTKHAAFLRDNRKLGPLEMKDCIITDGLTDPFLNAHMGETAEYLAMKYNIARDLQDKYAHESHVKAAKATADHLFDEEMVEVLISGREEPISVDEHIRTDSSLDMLSRLKPTFSIETSACITAGNSSGINDGAAAVVLCSELEVKNRNLSPLARIVAFAQVGLEPMEMGLGPVSAIRKVMEKSQWCIQDVDLFEINEAFAVQTLLVIEQLELPPEKVNVSGGAIALGHPIGASGARILVTLCYNLRRLGKSKGVAALCIGGGMGIAVAIEAA